MPGQIELKIRKTQRTEILKLHEFFFVCVSFSIFSSIQFEVQKIISVKSSLHEVRFNLREVRFNEPPK